MQAGADSQSSRTQQTDETAQIGGKPPQRFCIKEVKQDFLTNSDNAEKCLKWIEEIKIVRKTQDEIDLRYDELAEVYHSEMVNFYKPVSSLKATKKAWDTRWNHGGVPSYQNFGKY